MHRGATILLQARSRYLSMVMHSVLARRVVAAGGAGLLVVGRWVKL